MVGIVNLPQIDLALGNRTATTQIFRFQVVFAVLIVEFVIRVKFLCLSFDAFFSGQVAFSSKIMRTLIAEALVDCFLGKLLPDSKRRTAMRTKYLASDWRRMRSVVPR